MKQKVISKEDRPKIDMAVEQWTRLIIEHVKWKRANATDKSPKIRGRKYNKNYE